MKKKKSRKDDNDNNNNNHRISDHNQPQSGDCHLHEVGTSLLFIISQEALTG
jgi:hypothetical protein